MTAPRRDFLPSQVGDHITRALDESFERGVNIGRRMGLDAAADYLRKNPDTTVDDFLTELHRIKYANV